MGVARSSTLGVMRAAEDPGCEPSLLPEAPAFGGIDKFGSAWEGREVDGLDDEPRERRSIPCVAAVPVEAVFDILVRLGDVIVKPSR